MKVMKRVKKTMKLIAGLSVVMIIFCQCSNRQNTDVTITKDNIRVKKSAYEYIPKDYIEQLQHAANNEGEMLDMTATEDEDLLINIENVIVELAKYYFTKDRKYGYYMKDPYYRSTLYKPFCDFYSLDDIATEQIFFGCGSYDLWKTLLGYVIADGKIIGNAPQFPDFVNFIQASGREFIGIYRNDFKFPTQEIINAIEKEKEKCACILIDRPSNPTGLYCTLDEVVLILEKAIRYNIPVVIDEAYANYIPLNESVSNLIQTHKNLIWLRSNSKGYNVGSMRVGVLAFGSKEMANCFSKFQSPVTPDYFSILLAKKLFEFGLDYLKNLQNEIKTKKQILETELTKLDYFCLPSHPNMPVLMFHKAGKDLVKEFAELGIEVRSAGYYQKTIPIFDNSYVRIRVQFDNEKINKFLDAANKIK
jgi:histidinol-phosphate/aromatic aminotransferase/cobyric acid decarboxylase-like protein